MIGWIYFSVAARGWNRRAAGEEHLAPFMHGLQLLPQAPDTAILDLGTGAGATAAQLAIGNPGARVLGIDNSRRMIREARRCYRHPNLAFRRCDATRPPWPSGSFDLITAHNFNPYPPRVHDLLRPGGLALMSNTFQPMRDLNRIMWESANFETVARENIDSGCAEIYRRVT